VAAWFVPPDAFAAGEELADVDDPPPLHAATTDPPSVMATATPQQLRLILRVRRAFVPLFRNVLLGIGAR
jgi:hypothetical protein